MSGKFTEHENGYFRDDFREVAEHIQFSQPHASIMMKDAADWIDHLLEENKRLTAALAPFAKEAAEYKGWDARTVLSVTDDGNNQSRETWYSIADLRSAEQALTFVAKIGDYPPPVETAEGRS